MATARKRGKSYEIRASLGYDIYGKKLSRSIYWTPGPGMTPKQEVKELERQKILFDERVKRGQFLDGSVKLHDFAEKWLADYAEKNCKKKTVARYKVILSRINQALGHLQLEKIQPHHLIEFYNNLAEAGIRDDVKYRSLNGFKKVIKGKGFTQIKLAEKANVSVAVLKSCCAASNGATLILIDEPYIYNETLFIFPPRGFMRTQRKQPAQTGLLRFHFQPQRY